MFRAHADHLKNLLLDLFFPRHVACGLCGVALGEDFPWHICPGCFEGLQPVGEYGCRGCGRYVGAFALHGLCSHCLSETRWFDGGGSCCHYNDSAQAFVHGLKYHQKPWLAYAMAGQMHTLVRDLCAAYGVQALVPVPIHETRHRERGYNQAQLLAEELSKLPEIPPVIPLLARVRDTEPQNRLTLPERIRNVQGAFQVLPQNPVSPDLKRVMLIDDVLTTGNTLNACAKALKNIGCHQVIVATYASVTG